MPQRKTPTKESLEAAFDFPILPTAPVDFPPPPGSPEGLLTAGKEVVGDIGDAAVAIPGLLRDILSMSSRGAQNRDELEALGRK